MTEHKQIGIGCHLTAGQDFRLTEKSRHQVERMDIQIEQGITVGIGSRQIMKVVADKLFLAQTLFQHLYSRRITLLQAHHRNVRTSSALQVNQCVELLQRLAERLLYEQRLATLQHL